MSANTSGNAALFGSPLKRTMLKQHARTFLLADGNMQWVGDSTGNPYYATLWQVMYLSPELADQPKVDWRHNNMYNVVFVDGHVSAIGRVKNPKEIAWKNQEHPTRPSMRGKLRNWLFE